MLYAMPLLFLFLAPKTSCLFWSAPKFPGVLFFFVFPFFYNNNKYLSIYLSIPIYKFLERCININAIQINNCHFGFLIYFLIFFLLN